MVEKIISDLAFSLDSLKSKSKKKNNTIRDHPLSTYVKFLNKNLFITHGNGNLRVRVRGKETPVFRKFYKPTKGMIPNRICKASVG